MLEEQMASRTAVSNFQPPKAIGEVRYLDPAAIHLEYQDFRAVLDQTDGGFVEPFLTAPSPGIIAAAMRNEYYGTEEAYLDALADALRVEYEAIVGGGFLLQLDCPDLALERHITCTGPAPLPSSSASSSTWWRRSIGRSRTCRANACACTCAGATTRAARVGRAACRDPADHLTGQGRRLRAPVRESPPRPRVPLLRARGSGRRSGPGRGRDRHAHQLRRAPEVVVERIERMAVALGDPRRVLAGTDCGFDTAAGMGRVAEDVVWAKLRALAEGARLASERLF